MENRITIQETIEKARKQLANEPNREKTSMAKGKRKPGGQAGHPGTTLKPVVTEYQAEILENEREDRVTAGFPEGVGKALSMGSV
ncbi:MAG: hypothetical protein LBL76_04250 [Treponema sp.]|jgi:hypothetical protein|nr:hypothetical protein [Treponema sp.]